MNTIYVVKMRALLPFKKKKTYKKIKKRKEKSSKPDVFNKFNRNLHISKLNTVLFHIIYDIYTLSTNYRLKNSTASFGIWLFYSIFFRSFHFICTLCWFHPFISLNLNLFFSRFTSKFFFLFFIFHFFLAQIRNTHKYYIVLHFWLNTKRFIYLYIVKNKNKRREKKCCILHQITSIDVIYG